MVQLNSIEKEHMNAKWWKKAIVYQVYPKSFQDSNGDGIGDLRGITDRLSYLEELGIDVLWISPMFCSPMDDNGYDISDYYKVNPIFGTDEDMDVLLQEAKSRGIKIILDLVVNHCSDEHIWFQKAVQEPESREAGFFYFQKTEDDREPNNWRSNFGGSVWSRLADGRWYYHTFSPKQPDLNWENPELRKEIYKMINWWLEKGVAGFRVDAITFIKKDLTFASRKIESGERYPVENFTSYPGIDAFLQEMKEETFQKFDCITVAEAPGVGPEDFRTYAGSKGHFSMIFDFSWENMEKETDKSLPEAVERLKKRIFESQKVTSQNGWSALFLENHDQSRCVNRYLEEKDRSFTSASALAVLYFFLHGTPFLYEGQEIGMTNTLWNSIEEMDDVRAKTTYLEGVEAGKNPEEILHYFCELGRDNARTPMQWDGSSNAGFTKGTPWIKVSENYKEVNVEKQRKDKNSLLHFYKKLILLHKEEPYETILAEGNFTPVCEDVTGLIAYKRTFENRKITVLVNFLNQEISFAKTDDIGGKCLLNNSDVFSLKEYITMSPYQAVVLVEE